VLAAAFPLGVTGEHDCMSHKLDPSVMLGRVRPEARFIALLPPVHSGVIKKRNKKSVFQPCGPLASPSCRTPHAHSATPSPAAPPATSATARPHRLLAALTRHCAALHAHLPRCDTLAPPHLGPPDCHLLQLRVEADDRRLLFFRDLSVTSLNSMWASSSPLFTKICSST
jgi:hypothetical protein